MRTRPALILPAALVLAHALACGVPGPGPGLERASAVSGRGAGPRPNVVIVTVDTLRADRIGAYGSTGARTPNVDRLAAAGLRFERAYATYPKTNPALCSLMTGRYPSAHGVRRNGAYLPESELTLAELLRAAGYETAAFVSNHVMWARHGFAQGFDLYDHTLPDRIPTRTAKERVARHLVDDVLRWADARRGTGPVFLWVHFIDPHGPYTPPSFDRAVAQAGTGGREMEISSTDAGTGVIPAYQALPGVRRAEEYMARYDAEVEYADAEIGRLLAGLEAAGVTRGAYVVLAADHGESLGEHDLWFQHGSSLDDAQIRIPLIVAGPGIAPRVELAPASSVDIMPTILESLGLPLPKGLQGTSLVPRFAPPSRETSGFIFAELDGAYVAISGPEKLIWSASTGEVDLRDARADSPEEIDLAASRPESGRRLFDAVQRFTRENNRDVEPLDDAESRKVLGSLGYVE